MATAQAILIDPVGGVVEQAVTQAAEVPEVGALNWSQVHTKEGLEKQHGHIHPGPTVFVGVDAAIIHGDQFEEVEGLKARATFGEEYHEVRTGPGNGKFSRNICGDCTESFYAKHDVTTYGTSHFEYLVANSEHHTVSKSVTTENMDWDINNNGRFSWTLWSVDLFCTAVSAGALDVHSRVADIGGTGVSASATGAKAEVTGAELGAKGVKAEVAGAKGKVAAITTAAGPAVLAVPSVNAAPELAPANII